MAGMYPENQTLEIFGQEVECPGMGADGKFTNGSFSDPLEKPSIIPVGHINLLTDVLSELMLELRRRCNNNGEIDESGQPDFSWDYGRYPASGVGLFGVPLSLHSFVSLRFTSERSAPLQSLAHWRY